MFVWALRLHSGRPIAMVCQQFWKICVNLVCYNAFNYYADP